MKFNALKAFRRLPTEHEVAVNVRTNRSNLLSCLPAVLGGLLALLISCTNNESAKKTAAPVAMNGSTQPTSSAGSDPLTDYKLAPKPVFSGEIGYGEFLFADSEWSVAVLEATKDGSSKKFLLLKFSQRGNMTEQRFNRRDVILECQGNVCDDAGQITVTWINKDRFDIKLSTHDDYVRAGEYYREGAGPKPPAYGFVKPSSKIGEVHFVTVAKGEYSARAGTSETVEIEKDFEIQGTLMTQAQYHAIQFDEELGGSHYFGPDPAKACPGDQFMAVSKYPACANFPVRNVAWVEAQRMIVRLNSNLGLDCGDTGTPEGFAKASSTPGCYRLPTKNEWIAVTEGVLKPKIGSDGDIRAVTDYGWGLENTPNRNLPSGDRNVNFVQPVASKLPNALGIYDLYGSARQWLQDNFDDQFHVGQRTACGMDPENLGRGSLLNFSKDSCYFPDEPTNANFYSSFRLVRTK